MKINKENKRALLLEKPSGTISIAGNIDPVQRKFYNGFLLNAKEQLKKASNIEQFIISLETLKETLNVSENDKNNNYYKKIVQDLHSISIEYNVLNKDKHIYGLASLLDNVEIEKDLNTKEVIIKYTIPLVVKKSMLEIMKGNPEALYATIDLFVEKGLKSRYAIILYEICKDYEKVEVPEMTIHQFKKIFGIERKRAYKQFTNIKQRVLKPALDEINNNDKIDFLVNYELKKRGNTYTHIKFIVKPKPADLKLAQQAKSLIQNENPEFTELMALIPEIYRNNMSVIRIVLASLKEKGFDYTKSQIVYTNSQRNLKNYPAYLKKAIEENYAELIIKKMEEEQRRLQVQERLKELYGKRVVFKKRYIGILSEDGMDIDGTNSAFAIGDVERDIDSLELFEDYVENKVIGRIFEYRYKGENKMFKVLELNSSPNLDAGKYSCKIQDVKTGDILSATMSPSLIIEIGEDKREPLELE